MVNEQQLLELAKQGDRSAFRQLVTEHQRNVYFLALDLTGNRFDAEDLCQEVFIRAYKSLPKFRSEAKFGSWLYRITVNCSIDSRRRKQVMTVSIHEDNENQKRVPESVFEDRQTPSPETVSQQSTLQSQIEQALNRLTPRERSVFVLRHYQELPLKEIGEMLEIAEGTVKALLFRAIRRLQKELAMFQPDLENG